MGLVRKLIGYMPREKAYIPPGSEFFETHDPTADDWALNTDQPLSDDDIEQLCYAA